MASKKRTPKTEPKPAPVELNPYDKSIDAVIFKDEGEDRGRIVGPVYVRRGGESTNYQDTPRDRPDGKGKTAAWFTLADARRIAKRLGLPLFEV